MTTNLEQIRQMNSEELVNSGVLRMTCNNCVYQRIEGNEFIPCNDKNCKEGIKQWLESKEIRNVLAEKIMEELSK